MKIKRVPLNDIISLAKIVVLEPEDDESDEPFVEEGELKAGTYAMDGHGQVWHLEETMTGLFQEFMDAEIKRKK